MKLTKRETILVLILLTASLGYIYFRFVLTPEMNNISRLETEQTQQLAVLNSAAEKDIIINGLKKQLSEAEKKKEDLSTGITKPIRLPDVLIELEQACIKSGVQIGNISFSGNSSSVKGEVMQQKGTQSLEIAGQNVTLSNGTQDKDSADKKQDNRQQPYMLNISFTFNASYENLLSLINYYETTSQLYILSDLDIKGDSSGKCIGSMSLTAYSVVTDENEFLYNSGKEAVRVNPF